MTAKTPTRQKLKGKRLPHATWTLNIEMKETSFPNIHMCIIPAPEIMPSWQKKDITSVIQHPVMLWLEKIFLHGKGTQQSKHLQYNSLLLKHQKHMVKIDNGVKSTKYETTKSHNH